MGKAELLVSFLLCISAVHAADHVVGDNFGWTDISANYTEWAAGEKFVVGDKLIFTYDTIHDVVEVDKDGYDICVNSGSTPPYTGGNTTITLTSPGSKYFICTISDHCPAGGMKLDITVEGGGPVTPPSPSPSTTSPPSDITPSPSPSNTPPSDITPSPTPSNAPPSDITPSPSPSSNPPESDITPTPSPSENPPSDIPTTPPPLQSPPSGGGSAKSFGSLNPLLIGFSLISATLFVFMS